MDRSENFNVLNVGRLPQSLLDRISDSFQLFDLNSIEDKEGYLATNGEKYTGVITNAAKGINGELLSLLPNLKVVSSYGVGLDKIDMNAAAARGIEIGYTPEVLNDCVADIAFGLVIDVMRNISAADRFVRSGSWASGHSWPMTRKVSGKRLGLVGFGRIGQIIAKRAIGFDMEIRYNTRKSVVGCKHHHEPSLERLAHWCDVLVIICSGGPSTRHLIDQKIMDALGSDGFLINVSRGSVVDQQALLSSLQNRTIAGAGLDVFEDEPEVPKAFFSLPNVVLQPHVASNTVETRLAMANLVFDNLAAYFRTGKLIAKA
jgi:lactate dehydrogenase-like 2-hydroxyacid dehydrogenase